MRIMKLEIVIVELEMLPVLDGKSINFFQYEVILIKKYHSGNQVGYHVTQPCTDCLSSCNNGHFWMFHIGIYYILKFQFLNFYSASVDMSERLDESKSKALLWAQLPRPEKDLEAGGRPQEHNLLCR